jgi:hypothetical protein
MGRRVFGTHPIVMIGRCDHTLFISTIFGAPLVVSRISENADLRQDLRESGCVRAWLRSADDCNVVPGPSNPALSLLVSPLSPGLCISRSVLTCSSSLLPPRPALLTTSPSHLISLSSSEAAIFNPVGIPPSADWRALLCAPPPPEPPRIPWLTSSASSRRSYALTTPSYWPTTWLPCPWQRCTLPRCRTCRHAK